MRHSRGKFDAVASAQAAPARGVGFVVRCGESLRRACSLPPVCRAATTSERATGTRPRPPRGDPHLSHVRTTPRRWWRPLSVQPPIHPAWPSRRRRVAVAATLFSHFMFYLFFARPAGPALRGGGKGPISRAAPPGRAEPNLFRLGRTNPTRNPRTRNPAYPADDPAGWVCVWGGGESRFPLRFRFIGWVSPRRIPEVFLGRAYRGRI